MVDGALYFIYSLVDSRLPIVPMLVAKPFQPLTSPEPQVQPIMCQAREGIHAEPSSACMHVNNMNKN